MEFEWNENKNAANIGRHKISFDAVFDFDWAHALITDRTRHADGEPRFAAIGILYGKIYTIIYTHREERRRIISLRRSNKPEEKAYDEIH
ncbi:MAG: BrnT family toxin [Bdellovibrionales bacterium]|jgi:hypothetical protein